MIFFFYTFLYWEVLHSQHIHNIFTTNHKWLIVIGSNLNLSLRFFFAPTITINNNLPLMICCKNVIGISFLIKKGEISIVPPFVLCRVRHDSSNIEPQKKRIKNETFLWLGTFLFSFYWLFREVHWNKNIILQHSQHHSKVRLLMWDAKTSKNSTCLLLENKKQNIFTSKNNLESTRRKGFGIH